MALQKNPRTAVLICCIVAVVLGWQIIGPSWGHEAHIHFSAGEPGDPNKPARVVNIAMREQGRRMFFEPARLEVRKGEQVRFVLHNEGIYNHEFILATRADNRKHAQLMKKYPDMEHADPNGKSVPAYMTDEIVWRFTKSGAFEFACLIPGHLEAGMVGTITVK
jgi:uncharacterized cupredoxin-like copper-binding protein